MNHKPTMNRIIVERDKSTGMVGESSIIHATAKGKERPQQGKVIAVGDGLIHEKTGDRIPMVVKVGDKVMWPQFTGNCMLGTKDLWIMKESEVLAVVG